jgi:tRNA pseudouridine32 synthase/23S rRNA pseudouridine746 synthase/23S rRNA pseudouridine1911/1915/1917 synthase
MNSKALGNPRFLPKGLRILYEDRDLLVIHKPGGLLSVAAGKPGSRYTQQKTAYGFLTDYVKKGVAKSKNRIFIVHRLDKDTSGVMIFAKNPGAKNTLQANWDRNTKRYLAIVHGAMKDKAGALSSYLVENKELRVYATTDRTKGRLAKTRYKVIQVAPQCSLLEIELLTGRKNQIRVQLADVGHPVVGDKKYGTKPRPGEAKNKALVDGKHLALHAHTLTCTHPYTKERVTFTSPPPAFFDRLCGSS